MKRRDGRDSFFADKKQFGMKRKEGEGGRKEEGPSVYEADKNGNALPRPHCSTPLYQSFLLESGELEKRRGDKSGRVRGDTSQLCLTGLRAGLCGLML